MALVPELVRHHLEHLIAREAVDEVVVEHDALRVAEPVHVGVHARRAAAGIHAVDLADVHVRLARQVQDLRPELPLGERLEAIEERVDHHREEPDGHEPDDDHRNRAGEPPAPAEAPHQGQGQGPADRREGRGERRRLGHVAKPRAPILSSKTYVARPLVRDRGERQPGHHQGQRDPGPHGCAAQERPAGQRVDQPAWRAERDQREGAARSRPARPARSGAGFPCNPPHAPLVRG